MAYTTLPSLQANFTPVPEPFFTAVFNDASMTKEELIVSLFCFNQAGGWSNSQTLLHYELIVKKTSLTREEAESGLALAAQRNTLIELPSDDAFPGGKKLYMVNIPGNRQFVETYYTSPASSTEGAPPPDPSTKEAKETPSPPIVEDDYFAYEDDDEMIPFEDEIPLFEDDIEEPLEETAPVNEPLSEPPGESTPSQPQRERDWLPLGMSLPFEQKTIDMIGGILGRKLSKMEAERLAELGADDSSLIEAMSSLLSRTKKIYSSDLIIYEYEQIRSNERTSSKYAQAKAQRKEQIERQKNCMRCGGLGYTFKGLSTILECKCRKPD